MKERICYRTPAGAKLPPISPGVIVVDRRPSALDRFILRIDRWFWRHDRQLSKAAAWFTVAAFGYLVGTVLGAVLKAVLG